MSQQTQQQIPPFTIPTQKTTVTITFASDKSYQTKDREGQPVQGSFFWRYIIQVGQEKYVWFPKDDSHQFLLKLGAKRGDQIQLYKVPMINEKTGRAFTINCVEFKGQIHQEGQFQQPEQVAQSTQQDDGLLDFPDSSHQEPPPITGPKQGPIAVPTEENEGPDEVGLMVECYAKAHDVLSSEPMSKIMSYYDNLVRFEDLRQLATTFFIHATRNRQAPNNPLFRSENLTYLNRE